MLAGAAPIPAVAVAPCGRSSVTSARKIASGSSVDLSTSRIIAHPLALVICVLIVWVSMALLGRVAEDA